MYPGAFRDATYPTRDRVIPAGVFEVLAVMMDPLEMGEQFRMTNAVSLGKAMLDASEKDKAKVTKSWKALGRMAHPTIAIPLHDTSPSDETR